MHYYNSHTKGISHIMYNLFLMVAFDCSNTKIIENPELNYLDEDCSIIRNLGQQTVHSVIGRTHT